jgi:UDP-3-O-acyl-N-acetylglucosamine deacetylase
VRHVYDEPVRHAMVELLGDLALNAKEGHSGIPIGHIVAYKVRECCMEYGMHCT